MAKLVLDDIASGFGGTAKTNNNNASIEAEFQDKVLYRDNIAGEPNQMENDLDMNSNDVLNAGVVNTSAIRINGALVSTDPLSTVNVVKHYPTVAAALAATDIIAGDILSVKEHTSGNGGGEATWEVVGGTGTANSVSRLAHDTLSLTLVYQVDGMVNARALGIISDNGVTEQREEIQAVCDLFLLNDVFFPNGVYLITPTTNINGVTIIAGSSTRLIGEPGTIFYGDNALGPLVNYRASGNTVAGTVTDTNRVGNRGIWDISFKSTWVYVIDDTLINPTVLNPLGVYTEVYDVNDTNLFFDYKIGEGTCLAIGNDNVTVDGCSFYNTPAGILYESAGAPRIFGGVSFPHVYGGQLTNYAFRDCMYGVIIYADSNVGGQFVGGVKIDTGFLQACYKSAIATIGPVNSSTFTNPTWANNVMFCALLESPNEMTFGLGHYENGLSETAVELFSIAPTLNFNDLSADAAYTSVPVIVDDVYKFYGYIDHSSAGRNALITFETLNRPLYINRGVLVVADVMDETNNYTQQSLVDCCFTGNESAIHVRQYNSNKSTGGVNIYNIDMTPPFTAESGQMFRTASFINKSKKHENIARAPLAFGGNITGRDPDSFEADGVLTCASQEYVLLEDDTVTNDHIIRFGYEIGYVKSSANMFVLYSASIAVMSTSDAQDAELIFDCANKCNTAGTLSPDGLFRTYTIMVRGEDASEFAVHNAGTNDVTFRITDMQAVVMNSLTELNDYVASRTFATGRGQLDLDSNFIIELNPTDDGVEVITEYDWSADATSRNIYSVDNLGQNGGPFFELERLETKLISGTGAALTVDDDSTVGYWVASFTPAGTEWVTQTIANGRPTSDSLADSTIIFNPAGATTMKLQVRARLRFL